MLHNGYICRGEKPQLKLLHNNWRCNGGEIRQVIMGRAEPETYCTKPTEICSLYSENTQQNVHYSVQ